MKVCVLTQAFVRYPDDAIGSFVFRLARELTQRQIDVTVVAPHARGLASAEQLSGVSIARFHYAPERYERLAYAGRMRDLVKQSPLNAMLFGSFMLNFVAESLRVIRREKPDVIHAHWWFPSGVAGAVVAQLTGLPLVITCHGTDVALLSSSPLVRRTARQVFAKAANVTVVSDYLRRQLVSQLGTAQAQASVIPMPVDRVFVPEHEHTFSQPGARRRILAVGRLARQKGLETLLEASKLLVERGLDVGVMLIGEGNDETNLKNLSTSLGLQDRVTFLGFRGPAELAVYYRESDVVVLPARDEGLGLVLVEAMFCGAPVVGARSGGIVDLIADGETGFLTPPYDVQALALALQRALSDPAAHRLALAGQQFVRRNYDPDSVVDRVVDIYQHILEGHG